MMDKNKKGYLEKIKEQALLSAKKTSTSLGKSVKQGFVSGARGTFKDIQKSSPFSKGGYDPLGRPVKK